MSNRKMRVGDQMMDLITGEKKVIQSLSPEVTFEDGSKMENPVCYNFLGNNNPFPVPAEITINNHTMVIDGSTVDCGHFRPLKVLHKYDGGIVLEALAKDQQHKILLSYAVNTDRFFVLSEHAADRFDVVYDDGKIWIVRSERTDEVTDDEEQDENGNPVVHHPVFENLLIFNGFEKLDVLSSDWSFNNVMTNIRKDENDLPTLVFVSKNKRNEYGEFEKVEDKTCIERVKISLLPHDEDDEDDEDEPEYQVTQFSDMFLGKLQSVAITPAGDLFAIGDQSILYAGRCKRWANGSDVVEAAVTHPHLIRCEADGSKTTFVLANDQYEAVQIKTESTADRGLVSTVELEQ